MILNKGIIKMLMRLSLKFLKHRRKKPQKNILIEYSKTLYSIPSSRFLLLLVKMAKVAGYNKTNLNFGC